MPIVALIVVSVLSLGARALFLGQPCQSPCTTADQHTLIFDEAYYVQAARVIAGIRPPSGSHYAEAPLGTDPNAEHPQGAKLIMAAAIEILGDGPWAWRIGSLVLGSVAILGMYALVRAAGGGRWPAVGAAALMGCDNLLLVMSRIGTLDVPCVAGMVWAVALYLRRRPVASGVVLALATCMKEVAPDVLFVLALVELGRLVVARRLRGSGGGELGGGGEGGGGGDLGSDSGSPAVAPHDWRLRPAVGRLAATTFVTCGVFLALLAIMDAIATPYADAEARLITGGPWNEISHIVTYAEGLTSPHGPTGIASYPWQWLIDLKPILYLRVAAPLPGHTAGAIRPVVAFFGMVSPPILLVGMVGLAFAAYRLLWRGRRRGGEGGEGGGGSAVATGTGPRAEPLLRAFADRQLGLVGLAWFLGTWLPFALGSLIDHRTSYLYYMVIVMPGLYVTAVHLAAHGWRTGIRWLRALELLWALGVVAAAVVMYPFVPVF